jgi:hypothetical protein
VILLPLPPSNFSSSEVSVVHFLGEFCTILSRSKATVTTTKTLSWYFN